MSTPGAAMVAEMAAQPAVLRRLLDCYRDVADEVRELAGDGVRGVAFLARGSSGHAALLGRYRVEIEAGLPTTMIAPSIHTGDAAALTDYSGWLLVALSQSGRTPEIVRATARLAERGARTVAVTNDPDSDLAQVAHLTIALGAGPERAVPATKTVTAQMLAVLAVASGLRRTTAPASFEALDRGLVPAVEAILADDEPVREVAASLDTFDRLAVAGRGAFLPAALEVALKVQECTGMMAHGFSTADFRHGPIRVCGPDAPALLLAGTGPLDADTVALRVDLDRRGARSVVLSSEAEAAVGWPTLGGPGECLLATVRGQQLAYWLARRRWLDPDHPSGLQKITLTH